MYSGSGLIVTAENAGDWRSESRGWGHYVGRLMRSALSVYKVRLTTISENNIIIAPS